MLMSCLKPSQLPLAAASPHKDTPNMEVVVGDASLYGQNSHNLTGAFPISPLLPLPSASPCSGGTPGHEQYLSSLAPTPPTADSLVLS